VAIIIEDVGDCSCTRQSSIRSNVSNMDSTTEFAFAAQLKQ